MKNRTTTTTTTRPTYPTFDEVKRACETALASGNDATAELYALGKACAFSVLAKCIDPQRKTANTDENTKVSNNGLNPALLDARRGIAADFAALDKATALGNRATRLAFNSNGDLVREVLDKDAEKAWDDICGEVLTDGLDLVQTAVVAILEQAAEHGEGAEWLDRPYTTRRLSRRVLVNATAAPTYREEETTPIQEVYRAVRRAVADSRAAQTDPRNGYTYIEDLTEDGLETVYRRLGKWADLGGYETDANSRPEDYDRDACRRGGNYTADAQTVADFDALVVALKMTDKQTRVVKMRMQGYSLADIADALGVSRGNITNTVGRLRDRMLALGYTAPKTDK